ncbi:hypothetical protein F511_09527 [Dorcoceras hygrometricum]|uniref:DUF868 domain-containing protein n=1 Tax=Dorcoceras hygrometricum TaxID=472368 RepID=A0A2Z7CPC0_9LAMI|nr:hypothetical protein F511_09527 [Dorcoceras hygrometricum]
MRNCYSEHATKVSDSYCSGSSKGSFRPSIFTPSIQTSVACIYRVKHSNQKQFFVRLRWLDRLNKGFAFGICDQQLCCDTISKNSRILRKSRGTEAFKSCGSFVEISWDFSQAKFESGPEPINRFYLVVILDSEVSLILGDMEQEIQEMIRGRVSMGESTSTLVSRGERFSGSAVYSTRAKFSETGTWHDVLIKCFGEDGLNLRKNPALYVYMDKKMVIEVKRLRWNFRGNQTIFLDGLLVDMMWDVHDWIFRPCLGCGVFMFRTRSSLDSRLWLEDKSFEQNGGFSLLISAFKNPD